MNGLLLFLYQTMVTVTCNKLVYMNNVDCASYVDYVATDKSDYFRYHPFYVNLFRCHGANALMNPRNRQCVPTSTGVDDVKIWLVNITDGLYYQMPVENHTQCDEVCTLDQSMCSPYQKFVDDQCICRCKFEDRPNPNPCAFPFYWDKTVCDCVCSIDTKVCEKRKEFSKEECGCICKQKFHVRCAKRKKVVDEETCECVEPTTVIIVPEKSKSDKCSGDITIGILILVMVMELIVIIILYFLVYRYCYKRVYFKLKADRKAESITTHPSHDRSTENATTFQSQDYNVDNMAHNKSSIDKSRLEKDLEEEVPPYTFSSLNRNSLNRNSLNRNSATRLGKHSTPIYPTKFEDGKGIYAKDERSPLGLPRDSVGFIYSDIEPSPYNDIEPMIRDYDSEISSCEDYKTISLV